MAARPNRTHSIPVLLSLARTGQQLIRSVLDTLAGARAPRQTTAEILRGKPGADGRLWAGRGCQVPQPAARMRTSGPRSGFRAIGAVAAVSGSTVQPAVVPGTRSTRSGDPRCRGRSAWSRSCRCGWSPVRCCSEAIGSDHPGDRQRRDPRDRGHRSVNLRQSKNRAQP